MCDILEKLLRPLYLPSAAPKTSLFAKIWTKAWTLYQNILIFIKQSNSKLSIKSCKYATMMIICGPTTKYTHYVCNVSKKTGLHIIPNYVAEL